MAGYRTTRRGVLKAVAAGLVVAGLPLRLRAEEGGPVVVDDPAGLFYAFVERAGGRVVAVKSYDEVHPELAQRERALVPYQAPVQNVYLGAAPALVQEDAERYGIADMATRKALSGFDGLHFSYTPAEYTHHVLLNLGDRELGREELGGWALKHADDGAKARARAVLDRQHAGYNGRNITGDPDKMAEALRFYTGREMLRPVLFLGTPPAVGELAFAPRPIRLAALGPVQIAAASGGAVSGGISIGVGTAMAHAVSVAAEAATSGVSAPGAAVGHTAATGAGGGASSSAGDGGSGSGGGSGGSGSGSGAGGSGGGGGGAGGGGGGGGGGSGGGGGGGAG